jgi:hypothetical protein
VEPTHDDGDLLENELRAIQLLVEAHCDEFDQTVATLNGATSPDQARQLRRGKTEVSRVTPCVHLFRINVTESKGNQASRTG